MSLLHSSDRPYSALGSDARFILAIFTQKIAADQSPGHGVYSAARNI